MTELTQRKVGPSPSPSPPLSNDGKGVRVSEFDTRPVCANEAPRRYVQQGDQLLSTGQGRASNAGCLTLSGLSRELQEMFLPAGYPDSVSEDYLGFQFWDTLQAMCSYLRGVLATQSVLQSVGVGDDKATPLAAALQWVLRDGSGMIGGLTFAYFVGPKFDVNVKRWRLFADVVNDVGLTLDMVAPYFPTLVTEVLCVSSVCKAMCGVAAGATRSSLMTHFAKRDNMADCAAKEGSQETAVKLFGLMFGMYFANAVNSSPHAVWMAFVVLTLVHVYANYNAVSCLCIPTVNCSRGLILVQRFLMSGNKPGKENVADHQGRYSIRSVNQEEPIFKDPVLPVTSHLMMGSELHQAVPTSTDLDRLLQIYEDETYLLTVVGDRVHVMFEEEAKPTDELRAFFQAVLVLQALASVPLTTSTPSSSNEGSTKHQPLLESTYRKMTSDFPLFLQVLQNSGWRTHMFLLNTSTWRIKISDRT
ncbi:Vitamin B6 photo-protection and homoeostasis [Phytophthora infestans]|uniref:Vitamin B6 photo-protection and homoeostasis n=1 Tax=Phytophthora infestans TaxID=4787 RepID=A0A833SJ03_PHYIN|nr:Vitamin B6 photo-protection and homoeostasis [Phytophthora infestans]